MRNEQVSDHAHAIITAGMQAARSGADQESVDQAIWSALGKFSSSYRYEPGVSGAPIGDVLVAITGSYVKDKLAAEKAGK